jgi:hypothetical protein
VQALAVCDLGGGAQLFAGGEFQQAGGKNASRIARWDGNVWSSLGSGVDDAVRSLSVHDDGGGAALYVGGQFGSAGGLSANAIARWDSSGWSTLGAGLADPAIVLGITSAPSSGGPPRLLVCGDFVQAGSTATGNVAAWDGAGWQALGSSSGVHLWDSVNGVHALASYEDGGGVALYAGGHLLGAGAAATGTGLVCWDGSSWTGIPEMASLTNTAVRALAVFDPGTGPGLYVGRDRGVDMWNGNAWDPSQHIWTEGTFYDRVNALCVHDDGTGSALYVGGWFDEACVPGFFGGIFRWDGQACSRIPGIGRVNGLLSFDDGTGTALYAGCGSDSWPPSAGSVSRWDGSAWTGLGGDPGGVVYALAGFDDGSGPAVYAGGEFGVLRWDGAAWIPVGTGDVRALAVHDDGTAAGAALYATGRFDAQGSVPAASIARWDGVAWTPLGLGIETGDWHTGSALLSYDDGSGRKLWVGGSFHIAGGRPSVGIARWGEACGCTGTPYCTAKTSSTGCVPSMGSSGITNLTASQPFTLFATQVLNRKYGLLFYGTSGADSKPFLGGTLCVRSPIRRTSVQWSGGNPPPDDCSGMLSMDFKAHALSGVDPALVAGASVHAQYWYRDPADAYGSSTTDAVAFTLCP